MRGVAVYLEGGGQTGEPHTADAKAVLRQGMGQFLSSLRDQARRKGWHWKVVACGDRTATRDAFLNARKQNPDTHAILLVDAERPVNGSPNAHLEQTPDGWELAEIPEDHIHLMAQVMETWFVADPERLKSFYGQGFKANVLPKHAQLESVAKPTVAAGLEKATRDTKKGRYHKIRHGTDLLALIDPTTVRGRCPHCERVFESIGKLIS